MTFTEGLPSEYTLQHGENIARMAERMGHEGEWQAIALANLDQVPDTEPPLDDAAKVHVIAEKAGPGATLKTPLAWTDAAREPRKTEAAKAAEAIKHLEERAAKRRE